MSIYFDNAATTRMNDKVKERMIDSFSLYANPSSSHSLGLKARDEIEKCRENIATYLKVKSENLTFTSGATEAINIFFESLIPLDKGTMLLSSFEHEAVASWVGYFKAIGWKVNYVKGKEGVISTQNLLSSITEDTKAIFIMSVNNINGALSDISSLVKVVREKEKEYKHKILFFSDSVQALGKIDCDLSSLGVDGASFSSHKINGPKGVGLLYSKNPSLLHPLSQGGGQEGGKRGGTENTYGICGFDEAVTIWKNGNVDNIKKINKYLRTSLSKLGFTLLSPENASPFILSFSTQYPSEVMQRILNDKGIYTSSGSACSTHKKGKTKEILRSMGYNEKDTTSSIRISFSLENTLKEAEEFIDVIKEYSK